MQRLLAHHGTRVATSVRALLAAGVVVAGVVVMPTAAGAADPAPAASAFGTQVAISGTDVVPPTPTAAVAKPVGDASETTIDVPADPILVSGTLIATANVHAAADLDSALTVVPQELKGPYQARAVGQIENAGVGYGIAGENVALVSAAVIRAEAVAICTPTPTYAATSEIIDLNIAGSPVPVNGPVQDIIDGISGALASSGLDAVVNVQRNVVTDIAGGGKAVDALVVTILSAAGDTPLGVVRLAHAEITSGACAKLPQCSDGADNDGDAVIDKADPGCHSDGNAANDATYQPEDDDELNVAAAALPRTGGSSTTAVFGGGALGLALAALALRRRSSLP
jgi:LPXTG-motif cell wall-anchored protein